MKLGSYFKTEDIIRIDPEDTLVSALSLLGSSHDAAFVFSGDKHDKLEGVINPYHCFIRKSYPANTKVKHCLVSPPHLDVSDSIEKAARQMMESKIHYLPVFENKKFVGIISARRILRHVQHDNRFKQALEHRVAKGKKLVTIKETAYLSKALDQFKKHKISKLVVVSSTDHVEGMLTYYDIIHHLSTPVERQNFASRVGEKHPLLKKPVKNFYKKNVLALSNKNTYADAIEEILEKSIGSVVIENSQKVPVAIVTTTDILMLYVGKKSLPLIKMSSAGLSKGSETLVKLFIDRLMWMMGQRKDVEKAEVKVTEKKQGGVYEAVLSMMSHGQRLIIKVEDKNLQRLLKDIKQKARRLLSKTK